MGFLALIAKIKFTVQRGALAFNFADWRPNIVAAPARRVGSRVVQDWSWNPPVEWGDGGSGTREYRVQIRVGSTPSLGRWPGGIGTRAASPSFEIDPAQEGGYAQIRIRAINGAGTRNPTSGWYESDVTQVTVPAERAFSNAFGRAFG